jgi:hypothetical protein
MITVIKCTKSNDPEASNGVVLVLPTMLQYKMMLRPPPLTSTSKRQLSFIMVTKQNKLYDSKAYGTAYKVFLLNNATTLTFDLEKQ